MPHRAWNTTRFSISARNTAKEDIFIIGELAHQPGTVSDHTVKQFSHWRRWQLFFDDVKQRSGPFFDAHQLGVRFNFDVDVKKAAVDVEIIRVFTLVTQQQKALRASNYWSRPITNF